MNTYTVDWYRYIGIPVLLGVVGLLFGGMGLVQNIWSSKMVGCMLLGWAGISFCGRSTHRADFVSVADCYLMVRQQNRSYIFHAGDIGEIEYGRHLRLKLSKKWFDLKHYRNWQDLQYDLVQFGVRNGISVHAFGIRCMERGKYCRMKKNRQLIR
jgi:hypothetical protein